jgi:hypothetical protein
MPLTLIQIRDLAKEIERGWDLQRLTTFSFQFGININNSPQGSLLERALWFVGQLNTGVPPRDREMLQAFELEAIGDLKRLAGEMLTPGFFPPGNPHDAMILGRAAFLARQPLRQALQDFTHPSPYTSHVLIVRGGDPCGKSYTWEFLRHLALAAVGVTPMRLKLSGRNYTPREFLKEALELLGFKDNSSLPELIDDPQLARTSPLLNAFKSRVVELTKPYWLVVDDLNEHAVTPAVRETAYAMAFVLEEIKPPNLWLALLGYNPEIVDPELSYVLQDDAQFPTPALVATFFTSVATAHGTPLSLERATEISNVMFSQFQRLDREAMGRLRLKFEQMSLRIKAGQVP